MIGQDIDDLPKNAANFTALTPLWFLDRVALVHPNKTSLLHGSLCYTWHDTYNRCRRLASSLSKHCLGSTVHAFVVVVIACYSYLSILFPKKKKKRRMEKLLLWCFSCCFEYSRNEKVKFFGYYFLFFYFLRLSSLK